MGEAIQSSLKWATTTPERGGTVMDVDLWWLDLSVTPPAGEVAMLSPQEQSRAARFVFERDRRRYLAAHCAMWRLLSERAGRPGAALQYEHGPFGKPELPGTAFGFNLSHSQDVALLGIECEPVAAAGKGIGVDVEVVRPVSDARAMACTLYTDAERAALDAAPSPEALDHLFLTVWTRKEACLKAMGSGLSVEPQSFECGAAPGRARVTVATAGGSVVLEVESLAARRGVVAAVARCL